MDFIFDALFKRTVTISSLPHQLGAVADNWNEWK